MIGVRSCLVLAATLLSSAALFAAGIPEVDMAGNPLACDESGLAETSWGFAVEIPQGLGACRPDLHSLLIPLGPRSESRYVTCTGSFQPDEANSADEATQLTDEILKDPRLPGAKMVKKVKASLGGKPAERVVFQYRDHDAQVEMVQDHVIAVRNSHFYDLWLVTSAAWYKEDARSFERIIKGWHEMPTNP